MGKPAKENFTQWVYIHEKRYRLQASPIIGN